MSEQTVPMFPLNLVLFPVQILPLHIFEDRYRLMVKEIIDKDREFGVVLIERGSEVGGGDTRKNIGTLAEIIDFEKSNDGRWFLITQGTKRIKAARWLDDFPYPKASEFDPECYLIGSKVRMHYQNFCGIFAGQTVLFYSTFQIFSFQTSIRQECLHSSDF